MTPSFEALTGKPIISNKRIKIYAPTTERLL